MADTQTEYQRFPQRFLGSGMSLTFPPDLQPEGKYPLLFNVTRVFGGTYQCRFGYNIVSTTIAARIHSLKKITNVEGMSSPYAYFAGVGGELWIGQFPLRQLETGYSGAPLSIVPYRPLESPETWAYVSDRSKFRKYSLEGVSYQVGIAPPPMPPRVELERPLYASLDGPPDALWGAGGLGGTGNVASSPTPFQREPSGSVIGGITYDNWYQGTYTGWCTITPTTTSTAWIGARMTMNIGSVGGSGGENCHVEEVFAPSDSAAIITSIVYDSGTTGFCTITLNTHFQGLKRNQLIRLNAGGAKQEDDRVIDIIKGEDNTYSIRLYTGFDQVVGNTAQALFSFRTFTTVNHAAGENLSDILISFNCSGAGVGTVLAYYGVDASSIGGRPVTQDDYFHFTFRCDKPENIVEGRVYLDIDSTTNNFKTNALYCSFKGDDLALAVAGTGSDTTLDALIRSINYEEFFDNATGGDDATVYSTVSGSSWTEFIVPMRINDSGGWVRVGSDTSRTLAHIKGLQVYLQVSGPVTVQVGSYSISGTYGPDVQMSPNGIGYKQAPYQYRYSYRSSRTGAKSIPSPANYSGVLPNRGQIHAYPVLSTDPQVDKIDWYRLGGTAGLDFHYCGTTENKVGGSIILNDSLPDTAVVNGNPPQEDCYMPFAVDDLPHTGVANAVGNTLNYYSGEHFNPNWVPGTVIVIDQVAYTIYQPPTANQLVVSANIGSRLYLPWTITAATVAGTPLRSVWGPLRGRLWGCGDDKNPGVVYYTDVDNPDSSSDKNWVEVTSPSEPMMNGCIYEDSNIAFSSDNAYRLQLSYDVNFVVTPQKLANGRGLYARYGLAVGPKIWIVARDGIYEYAADGGATSITNGDLYPLFPHDGVPGQSIERAGPSVVAPDYNNPDQLRLSWCHDRLKFDYLGIDGGQHTLSYDPYARGWEAADYARGVTVRYSEEGAGTFTTLVGLADGSIGREGGYVDEQTPIPCIVQTPSYDFGDPRTVKQFGDLTLDVDPANTDVRVAVLYDNQSQATTLTPVTGTSRTYSIVDIGGGLNEFHRNMGLQTWWVNKLAPVILYGWEASYIIQPEYTQARVTDWTATDYHGRKFVQGARIHANTNGLPFTFNVQKDNGEIAVQSITINSSGEGILPLSWEPFETHLLRIVPTSGTWQLYDVEWVYEPAPETAAMWKTQWTSHDIQGYQHIREIYIPYRSAGPVTFNLLTDTGQSYTMELPPAPNWSKRYYPLPALKAKLFQYTFTGRTDLQLARLDTEVRLKGWGVDGAFLVYKPFGDISRTLGGGARI